MGGSLGGSLFLEIFGTTPQNGGESNFQNSKDYPPEWGGESRGEFWGPRGELGGSFREHYPPSQRGPPGTLVADPIRDVSSTPDP